MNLTIDIHNNSENKDEMSNRLLTNQYKHYIDSVLSLTYHH